MGFNITTDSNGDGEATVKLVSDIIIGDATAFKVGNFESVEFFQLIVYTRIPDVNDPVSGGGEGGGTGGRFGSFPLSPPKLSGVALKRGNELVVKIKAGPDNAASDFRVLIPYQVVE